MDEYIYIYRYNLYTSGSPFDLLSHGWCTYFHDYKSMIWTNPVYGVSVDTKVWKVVHGY